MGEQLMRKKKVLKESEIRGRKITPSMKTKIRKKLLKEKHNQGGNNLIGEKDN